MGQYISYDKHFKFRFGYYVESHEYCNITNCVEEQTISGIFLGPTANLQGSYKLCFLRQGMWLHSSIKYHKYQF